MQIALLLAMFSLLAGVMSSFVVTAVVSVPQLGEALEQETLEYFKNIEKVVNRELTPNQFQAMAPGTTMADFMNQPAIRQLAPGRWGNPLVDSWGRELRLLREPLRQHIALTNQVVAPVTGFVFISAGQDGVFQTELPRASLSNTGATANGVVTLASLQSVVAPTGSDDVVLAFTDEEAQRNTLEVLKTRLGRIAGVMLRDYQTRLNVYRAGLEAAHRQELLTNPAAVMPDLTTMLQTDPNAPRFADINTEAARQALGVTEEFVALERLLPNNGGRMMVRVSSNDLRQQATVTLLNFTADPSPWPTLNLTITIQGGTPS